MTAPADATPADPAAADIARRAARLLIEVKAVNLRPHEPFIFTSGRASPVYVDCRRLVSFPRARRLLMRMGAETIWRKVGAESVDFVAGGETAGIPFAAWLSDELGVPMLYVRKKPKGFGRNAQIEGEFPPGARVLLVEDLATDGGSKMLFVDALRKADAKVAHAFVIFHYGIFPEGIQRLTAAGVTLHALATWADVVAAAEADRLLDAKAIAEIRAYLKDPDGWSLAHGGKVPAAEG
ncbi:MAG: orotate phosphoribosyltransferase [Alphaproteobacteria bacterium]|nr:orotate phosphoribosyltransferase [Alphaproteobacteria bacterium]